jgi:hypothetical protein
VPCAPPTVPPISAIPPTADKVPCASLAVVLNQSHQDSPKCFSLPSEEDVLGLEEDVLGFQITNFPPGLLSLQCAGAKPQYTVAKLGLQGDSWAEEIRAQFSEQTRLQDSLVHIVRRPRVCGLFGDKTRVYTFTTTDNAPSRGLCDSGANLCTTNNPNLLVDVRPCAPTTRWQPLMEVTPTQMSANAAGSSPYPLSTGQHTTKRVSSTHTPRRPLYHHRPSLILAAAHLINGK